MKKFAVSMIFLFSIFQIGRSQSLTPQVIASDGEYFTGANGSVSWTLGEIMTETYGSANNFLTQGFQQPESMSLTATGNLFSTSDIGIYPNPVSDHLTINFSDDFNGTTGINIYDMQGKLIRSENFYLLKGSDHLWDISLKQYSNGIYLINIFNNNSTQTFKINKAS